MRERRIGGKVGWGEGGMGGKTGMEGFGMRKLYVFFLEI